MIFDLTNDESSIIKVIGVGGGGSNAVSHMYRQGIVGVDFAICNTDAQAMQNNPVPVKIQLGPTLTEGRGAGSHPQVGKQSCLESIDEIKKFLESKTKMLFVTAGMGGGTGTGAAPIIAKTARDMDILTVGIVTLPFSFEGKKRTTQGYDGLEELKKNVDTIIVISNDKLRQIYGNLSISGAFNQADDILTTAAKGIAEIITVPGYVNVDFEDVRTVMKNSGVAIMGIGVADGDKRARKAVDDALSSPLLEDNNIQGAQHILINITSGTKEVTMDEIFEITQFVQDEAGFANLIWGNCYDETLGDSISVTLIATGFESRSTTPNHSTGNQHEGKIVVSLDDDLRDGKKNNLFESAYHNDDHSRTFEFDSPRNTFDKLYKKTPNQGDPYVRSEDKDKMEEERRRRLQIEQQRREKLRNGSNVKLSNPQVVNDLESEPAYLRRGVKLENVPHSSETDMSKWTIDEDDELRTGNSYLHDNVD